MKEQPIWGSFFEVDDKVDDLSVLSSPLQSLPVLIAWGRCVRFVEFPDLFTPGHCLREARAGGSNPLTPRPFSLVVTRSGRPTALLSSTWTTLSRSLGESEPCYEYLQGRGKFYFSSLFR